MVSRYISVKNVKKKLILLLCLLSMSTVSFNSFPALATANYAQSTDVIVDPSIGDALLEDGEAKVIVVLGSHDISELDSAAERSELSSDQREVIRDADLENSETKKYTRIPAISTTVDKEKLESLRDDSNVMSVHLSRYYTPSQELMSYENNISFRPALTQAVPLLGASAAWSNSTPYTGTGQKVVIIDTGVQSSHPFLAGAVTEEVCYAEGIDGIGGTGACPNGLDSQIGTGSAAPCGASPTCSHGTHVAGIAAGRTNVTDGPVGGIAPTASIVAIQVFTTYVDGGSVSICADIGITSPCVLTGDSDILNALNYVLSNESDVASINMSLGGGSYSTTCDSTSPSIASAISQLRTDGILTAVASGNASNTTRISWPACMSDAVAVGSTTKADVVANYSNSNSLIALWGTGSSIRSSVPPTMDVDGNVDGFGTKSGTSMATPMIAGAIALVRQAHPTEDADDILARLQLSGAAITDTRNSITRHRPYILNAITMSNPNSSTPVSLPDPPASVVLQARAGYGALSWTSSTGATSYQVYDINNTLVRSVNAPTTSTTVTTYKNASARFSVRAVNDDGVSAAQTSNTVIGLPSNAQGGYALFASNGAVASGGSLSGYARGSRSLNYPIVGGASDPYERGGWSVASDGGIFTVGNVQFYGSTGSIRLNQPIVGMASTASGKGYWLVARDGGIFSFGDAQFYGSTGSIRLNQPITGMSPTISGRGYWLVASDGGIFSFGDAQFYGSTGSIRLNQPIIGMKVAPEGNGYWLFARDGGVFTFNTSYFGGGVSTGYTFVGAG